MTPLDELRAAVEAAAAELRNGGGEGSARPTLERPKKADFGDYSTNAAMLLAPVLGSPPRDVAGRLGEVVSRRLEGRVAKVDVAGPGFLNLFLADAWFVEAVRAVLEAGDGWGSGGVESPQRINVEFVSANPTGPLTAAGGRHAAYGDGLARLLEFQGHTVEREYYLNDAGSQVSRLGESIHARARGAAPGEDGYQGEYVADLAERIEGAGGPDADIEAIARQGIEILVEGIRKSLHDFGVDFDTWFSERSLHESDRIERAYARLHELGVTYESEGALWLRTTKFGDDKDRVLRRSNGEHTYFAPDIAYHLDKLDRGSEKLIDVWGADHHSYATRMRIAFDALGYPEGTLELLIMQFVNLIERGERQAMGKRQGQFVTLDDLISDIGVDAARWFMLSRSHDTTVDIDLDLARSESSENPVYYVQYAHARMSKILRDAPGGWAFNASPEALHPSERDLVLALLAFPEEIAEATERRAPHRISTYVLDLSQRFSAFYRDCKVLDDPAQDFRLGVIFATRAVVARSLGLLGISAPESM